MKGNLSIRYFLENYPLFLLSIPFSFLIHKENYYYRLLVWEYIIADILIYLSVPIIAFAIIGRWWRSYTKAGTFACISLIVFYFFQPFYDEIKTIKALSFFTKYSVILPILLIGFIILIIYIHRSKKSFRTFYYISNLLFLLLLTGGIIQYIYLCTKNPLSSYDQADPSKALSKNYIPCDTCTRPDIYFLLFDGYTNSKTLKEEFGYNNSWIEEKLHEKGFQIPSHSKSNYNFTHMSIGSELNLSYLINLDNNHRFYTKDFFEANYTIRHNELCDILKKQDYDINNLSIFDLKDNPVAITPAITQLTWRSVLGQTFFNKLRREIGWQLIKFFPKNHIPLAKEKKIAEDVRRITETFEGVVTAVKGTAPKPKFVYAHFLMPHETYYFDSSGKRLDAVYTAMTLINPKDYISQLVYTNKFIITPLVDSLLKYARRPSVIIIQGDHGYRNYPPEKVSLEFENFSAIYFSDKDYSNVSPDSLSSVNTFRIVLNKYFNQKLPMLKDSTINLYKYNTP